MDELEAGRGETPAEYNGSVSIGVQDRSGLTMPMEYPASMMTRPDFLLNKRTTAAQKV